MGAARHQARTGVRHADRHYHAGLVGYDGQYKRYKGLKTESLRDNMTNLELVLNMLAEATTTEISKERRPRTFAANRIVAAQGGRIAGNTRREIEAQTGKKIVSRLNAEQALAAKEIEPNEEEKE